MKKPTRAQTFKVIYNPHAGLKRRSFPTISSATTSLEDLKHLFQKYELPVDFYPTEYPGHATELAHQAVKEGYKGVLVAGGDGTVGEAANGLVDTNLSLGILPLGSYMNVARMLSIPTELEKAVMLIKLGRMRKIDVGVITTISGEQLDKPYIFLESVGFGLEAQVHQYMIDFDHGDLRAPFRTLHTIFEYFNRKTEIMIDDHHFKTRTTMINISNGPYSGPAIPIAPEAKLNDHQLTVTIFRLQKFDLLHYFMRLWMGLKRKRKPTTYQAKKVTIKTKDPRPVHADARLFGETPIEVSVLPNAISVYTGFADPQEQITSLKSRTWIGE